MTEPTKSWFLTTALLVSQKGDTAALSGLAPADNERDARMNFAEQLLDTYGPQGWAVRECKAAALGHLDISVRAQPESEGGEVVTLNGQEVGRAARH